MSQLELLRKELKKCILDALSVAGTSEYKTGMIAGFKYSIKMLDTFKGKK